MRKIITLFIFISASIILQAANYSYLILKQSDGNEIAFESKDLRITYDEKNINVATPLSTVSLPLSSLYSMYFSETLPASINTLNTDNYEISIVGKRVSIKAAVNTLVTISDLKGAVIARHTTSSTESETVATLPSSGIYIIKTDNNTAKIQVQ